MPGARTLIGSLLLRTPERLRSLRNVPVLGNLIHGLSHRLLPAGQITWARVEAGPAAGLWLELNPRTGQDYLHGDVESAMQAAVAEQLRPDSVFYDLGANIGLFTLLAARCVGPAGKVFSFEPDPAAAARLRRNIARNGFANVTVVEAGVWSSSGNFQFVPATPDSPDRGVGTFMAAGNTPGGAPVPCFSLDDFIRTAPLPDAIKCDVEGAELEVLRGAENLLKMGRPWILCEMHSEANSQAARGFLGRLGYTCGSVDGNHILAKPNPES
jgi:FkbM family methyltransferase